MLTGKRVNGSETSQGMKTRLALYQEWITGTGLIREVSAAIPRINIIHYASLIRKLIIALN